MFKKLVVVALLVLWAVPVFAQSVETVWVRTYNSGVDSWDEPQDMKLDNAGNVYVTGVSSGTGTPYDFLTVKYDHAGNELWVRRYSGPANADDRPQAMALDGTGNVYVTGGSCQDDTGTYEDYVTVKYDSFGNECWVRRYHGSENLDDRAMGIAVDNSGHVYVTGYSAASETGYDYVTVKYDQEGNELWTRRYNRSGASADQAFDVAVDASGNVYVTGTGGTIKYNNDGDLLWTCPWGSMQLALDSSDKVLVSGLNGRAKLDGDGNLLWAYPWSGWDLTTDQDNNVYLVGESANDYITIKCYPDGDIAWEQSYDGPANEQDVARCVALDDSANVYVAGTSNGIDTRGDYAIVKYDPDGNELWVRRYNVERDHEDGVRGLAVTGKGAVYVTGYGHVNNEGSNYVTLKYVQFLRGDVDDDGEVNLVDVVFLIEYVLRSGPPPVLILQVGDVNCDGDVNTIDLVYLVNYLFKDGPAPCI